MPRIDPPQHHHGTEIEEKETEEHDQDLWVMRDVRISRQPVESHRYCTCYEAGEKLK